MGGIDGELTLERIHEDAVHQVCGDDEYLVGHFASPRAPLVLRFLRTWEPTIPFQKSKGRLISAINSMKSMAPLYQVKGHPHEHLRKNAREARTHRHTPILFPFGLIELS
jgi:hypothetical protein